MTGMRVVSDDGAEIVRARDVGVAGLDHAGGPPGRGLVRKQSRGRPGDHRSFRLLQ